MAQNYETSVMSYSAKLCILKSDGITNLSFSAKLLKLMYLEQFKKKKNNFLSLFQGVRSFFRIVGKKLLFIVKNILEDTITLNVIVKWLLMKRV